MSVSVKNKGGVLYAFIKGDIDHHTAPEIRSVIDDAVISNENAKMLVIDFDGVSFMDSSGVGLVMGRYRLLNAKGKQLKIQNISQRDYRIFKMSGIEALAQINLKATEKTEVTYE